MSDDVQLRNVNRLQNISFHSSRAQKGGRREEKKPEEAKFGNPLKSFAANCLTFVSCKFTLLTLPDLRLRDCDPYNSPS